MRVVLIGGGKIGSYLARELVAAGHFVAVIEAREDRAEALSNEVEAVVIHGDGTNVEKLKSASVHDADWLVAVTGLDEVNLVACELGPTLGAKRVLARLNTPRNRPTFDALKIPVVGITDLMTQVISQEVAVSQLHRTAVLGKGQLSLCELDIPSEFAPIELRNLELPAPSIVVVVLRDDQAIVPEATTQLRPGDRITAVTTIAQESALHQVFVPNGDPA